MGRHQEGGTGKDFPQVTPGKRLPKDGGDMRGIPTTSRLPPEAKALVEALSDSDSERTRPGAQARATGEAARPRTHLQR